MSLSPKEVAKRMLGPMLVGTFLDTLLTGVTMIQLSVYFHKFKKDSVIIKLLVLTCAALNLTMTCLNTYTAYNYAVLDFGDMVSLQKPIKPFEASLLIIVFPTTFVQLFFAWRVMRLTNRLWVMVVVSIFVAAQWGFGVTAMSIGFKISDYSKGQAMTPYLLVWWGVATATDTLISGNLVWYFQSRRTGFLDTEYLLSNLTKLTIRTGALVTTWTIATVCFNVSMPNTNMGFIFVLSLCPMYLIALLSTLNARYYAAHGTDLRWSEDSPRYPSTSAPRRMQSTLPVPSEVHVTRTVEAEAFDLEDRHPTTKSWAARDVRHVVDIAADDNSIRDLDRKVDVELGADS